MIANKLRGGAPQPTKKYTASGALSTGDLVVLNADNTVSVVAESTTNVSMSLGSPTVFSGSNRAEEITAIFDTNSNKVVVAYRDFANSSYGTIVIGTVSGTSISFGTPVVFQSNHTDAFTITFDSNSNKIAIIRSDWPNMKYSVGTVSGTTISLGSTGTVQTSINGGEFVSVFDTNSNNVIFAYMNFSSYPYYGYIRVGTVSGTSMSFTSAVAFNSGLTDSLALTFDSNSNKTVVIYRHSQNYARARVGTVSSNTISLGSYTSFKGNYGVNGIPLMQNTATFDSNSNKVVIFFQARSPFNGKFVVGTVSGTSISFSSPVTFNAGEAQYMTAVFDTSVNKVIIVYQDKSNSGRKTMRVGTVSGTSISFGSEIIVDSMTTFYYLTAFNATTFESNSDRVAILFKDQISGTETNNVGTAIVLRNASSTTNVNLTSSNFIGISDGTYADTSSATIKMNRATDNNQSGLTTGSTYYAQTDGTLSATADSPSVSVGVARTSTSIKIKGSNA